MHSCMRTCTHEGTCCSNTPRNIVKILTVDGIIIATLCQIIPTPSKQNKRVAHDPSPQISRLIFSIIARDLAATLSLGCGVAVENCFHKACSVAVIIPPTVRISGHILYLPSAGTLEQTS